MKAKEYAEWVIKSQSEEEIGKNAKLVSVTMYIESQKIMKARNISTDQGLIGLLNEFDDKWQCVCRLVEKAFGCPVLKKTAFRKILADRYQKDGTDLFKVWHPKKIRD